MKTNRDRVLITGASSGIGLELARIFAREGHPLIITATVESELAGIARELTHKFGAEVLFVAQNLLKPQAAAQLYSAIQSKRLRIGTLVNNAGVGHKGAFIHQSLQQQLEMIHLNIESLVAMTRLFLPDMIARGEGRILNVASTGSDLPAPLMAVAHATKAFMLSFSEAVSTEIKDTGVTMTTLCPGGTDTDFFPRADAVESVACPKGNVLSPQAVAEEGYAAMMKGERFRIAGSLNRATVFSSRFVPEFILAKFAETFYADVKEDEHQREPVDSARRAAVAEN
jgi:short-subunit dehydrogenase